MSVPTLLDHLLVLLLLVVNPALSTRSVRAAVRAAKAGAAPSDPSSDYRLTILQHVVLAAALLLGWLVAARPWEALGLGVGDASIAWWMAAAALGVAGVLPVVGQAVQVRRHATSRSDVREAYSELAFLLPRRRRHLHWFYAMSLSAGVSEELLFRGFLIAYFTNRVGLWPAMLLAAVGFAIGHLYQGPAKALQVGVLGVWFGCLYLATGALWLPMLCHAVFDVIAGRMLYDALSGTLEETGGSSAAGSA